MLEVPSVIAGMVRISNLEGRHYELETSDGKRYVLAPAGKGAARLLEASVGKAVRVAGYLQEGPNIFMRGPVLRVTEVLAES